MSVQSITYDIPGETLEPDNDSYDHIVVHFRPAQNWNGENYGFDWIRKSDTNISGDIIYAKNLGKLYSKYDKKDKKLQDNFNSTEGTFIKHPEMYEELLRKYFPEQHVISFKIPEKAVQRTPENLQKYCEETAKYMYYTPLMTLNEGVEANLELIVEMGDRKNPPEKIEIRGNEEFFEINGSDVMPKKGKYNCTIKCLKTIEQEEAVRVVAIYKDSFGNDREVPCGSLRIHRNNLKNNILKVLCVEVKLDGAGKSMQGEFTSKDEEYTKKIFNQALVYCQIETDQISIDVNKSYVLENGSANKFINYLNESGKFIESDHLIELCLTAYKEELINRLVTSGQDVGTEDPIKQYDSYSKMFFFENPYAPKTNYDGVETAVGGSTDMNKRFVTMFGTRGDYTVAHELLHTLGLIHSFNNKDVKKQLIDQYVAGLAQKNIAEKDQNQARSALEGRSYLWDTGLFTYRPSSTDNILDYFNTKPCATWYWQWKIIWKRLKEING